ncbi:hypothetical protein BC629DRAFT_1738593 [Irpex lacteus]|nr:hypothetical protein BC629DRAFT_1738593 [Irpex lacteus]
MQCTSLPTTRTAAERPIIYMGRVEELLIDPPWGVLLIVRVSRRTIRALQFTFPTTSVWTRLNLMAAALTSSVTPTAPHWTCFIYFLHLFLTQLIPRNNLAMSSLLNSTFPGYYDATAEASCSRGRDVSEQPSVTHGSDTEPDAWMTDATLVEDTSEDYEDAAFATAGKGKERAMLPLIPVQSHRITQKETLAPVSIRPRRSAPDSNGICEVILSAVGTVDEKMVHFSIPPQAELPCMKQKTLKPLIRPAPNYNLPSLKYTIDLRDRCAKPIPAVVEAIAHRKAVIDGITEKIERALVEQKRDAFELSCLTCRKEGLHCTAKVIRDRQLPCTACARTEVPCRWAAQESGLARKRKGGDLYYLLPLQVADSDITVPFDVQDDSTQQVSEVEGLGRRPVKRRRLSPVASLADRTKKGRRSPI